MIIIFLERRLYLKFFLQLNNIMIKEKVIMPIKFPKIYINMKRLSTIIEVPKIYSPDIDHIQKQGYDLLFFL